MSAAPIVLGITIRADGSAQVAGEINRVQTAVTGAGTAAQNTNREFANMARSTQSLSSIMGAFGVTLGLVGLVTFAKELTKTVEQVQNLSIRLKGLTKDADDYAKVQDYLVDVSNRHHKSNLQLQASFAGLLAIEQTGIITRQQSMALLEGMSNASSKTGATSDALKQSTLGLSQALSMGTLQWEEMKQVTEPIPGLLTKIAEAAGYTGKSAIGDFKNVVSAGQVTSDMFGRIMVNALSSYQGAAADAGETLTAKYADIGNSWTALAKAVEAPVVNTLSPILDLITSQIHGLAQDLRELNDFYNTIKSAVGYGVGEAPDNGQTVDLTGRAKPPAQADPAKDSAAAIRAEIEATASSTKAKKEHKAAISDEERASIALTKSFNDAIESLNLHNIGLSKTPRELEEATLKSKHYTDAMVKQALALYDIGTALEAKKKLNETEKTELQALTDQYNKLTLSAHDYYVTTLIAKGIPTADQAPLVAQFDKNAGLEASKKAATEATTTLDAYNKSLDSTNSKTSDLGKISSAVFDGALGGISAMAGAFDTMVNSISANTKALEENAKMKKLNDQETDPAKKAANFSKYAKEEAKLNNDNIKAQLTGASQLAGAAASMFDKKSAAAKAFHAIEVTLSVARLAMDAVEMASTIGKTIANVSAGAAAMFRDMGPLGFVGVAAMLAVMAGLGFAASGGGSSTQAPPKSSPDTGSVLGDTSASSDSVNKTYTLLKDIQAQNYPVLKSIDAGISGLASGISNVITRLYQGGGLSASTANLTPSSSTLQTVITGVIGASSALSALVLGPLGLLIPLVHFIPVIGPILGSITNFFVNGIFGGNKSRKVTGQGIGTDPTSLGAVRAGNNVNSYQYANIETKTDGGWFGSDKYSTAQQRSGIDSATQKAFNSIFKSMGDTMFGLADALGGDLTKRVNDYVIPAMNVELKGLSGDDAAKKMNGIINTMLDNMASAVFGDVLGQYQKLGEGMLETAVRVVSQIAVVKDALESSSIKLVDNIIAISDALVNAAGGLKEFQSQFATYFDKFYSDTEKQAKLQTQLNSQLVSVGESLASSREGYRKQVEAIDITTAAGQAQYTMMLKLASAADTYYTALDAQTKVYTDAISTAKSNLASAYKSESDAITATISKLGLFIASLKNLKDSLALGNLSTGTPLDKYNEARRQLGNTYNTIQGGAGTTTASKAAYDAAVGGINTKLTAFLDASKTYNASGSGYTTDYQQVMGMIDSMGLAVTAQQTDAERQLEQLTKSVDVLITINTSVLSVKDALAGVTVAIVAMQALQADRDTVDAAAKQAAIQSGLDRAAADKAAADKAADKAAKALDLSTSSAEVVRLVAAYQKTSVATGANSGASLAAAEAVNNFLRSISGRFNETYNPNPAASAQETWTLTPKFATGGAHAGGWRIVGEHGPELEHTGPSQIFSNAQSKSMFGSGDDKASQEIVMELRALRAEVSKLRAEQRDNTGALIQSNYDANDQAADKVVTGTKDTAKQSAWAANSKAVIA